MLVGDIDDFKAVNDTYGHQIGDEVLQVVSGSLRSSIRVFDVCARYGGDEFVIVMPGIDRSSAFTCAERIRQRISDGPHPEGTLPHPTMSVGVAVIEPGDTPADLLRRADRCLYQAKADGKNRVSVHAETPKVRQMPLPARHHIEPA